MDARRIGEIMMPLEMFPYCPYWFTLRQAFSEIEDMERINCSAWCKGGTFFRG